MVATKPCHNCRRRRIRCDRSVPGCHKCTSTGRECSGYGKLYKWVDNAASRSQVTKKDPADLIPETREPLTPESDVKGYVEQTRVVAYQEVEHWSNPLNFSLLDPLFQDLGVSSRHYLNYYAVRFCQDLIVYDAPQYGANPFRDLVPMSQEYPFLREIVIAASALHFWNTKRWNKNPQPAADALVDALRARHKAIKSLQTTLDRLKAAGDVDVDDVQKDALLAAVLFFVNFALVDSGKGGWRAHMGFVGKLLSLRRSSSSQRKELDFTEELQSDTQSLLTLSTFEPLIPYALSYPPIPLSTTLCVRDYIASDSVAYYIWSSALDSLVSSTNESIPSYSASNEDDIDILPILFRTEANSYHSCPSRLLYAVFRTSQLARDIKANETSMLNDRQVQSCLEILKGVQVFDTNAWAEGICAKIAAEVGYLDETELEYRRHIGNTFRAAVCLYVLLIAPNLAGQVTRHASLSELGEDVLSNLPNTAELTNTILYHLSFIPTDSPLFKSGTWAVFLTGIETANPAHRAWVLDRFREYRVICPWGMITSTMETLVEMWQMRDNTPVEGLDTGKRLSEEFTTSRERDNINWLIQLQGLNIDCLIV
ncbi:fungal-specific transcription factor domain-containing protein [Annulohypoxylon maeteangense]|uniref:fungal-specific transcription factor domain-containing protein n=1 Tax=Annulohypoxylon maeteangense TaxID=1927788 RepID=UPI002007264A|nr:fungal-specific transcription factor domain-containing protein [Annulohypoxylon maeteangense]KAI0880479.1 fungal-specific transcription factor domain-containing protein [Annulohypoxylon maeteangense]